MPKQPANWPAGVLPRGLDVAHAAYYVGLSPTTFLDRVKEGKFPSARRDGKRLIWDLVDLDAAMDRLGGRSKIAIDNATDADEEKAVAAMQRRRAGGVHDQA